MANPGLSLFDWAATADPTLFQTPPPAPEVPATPVPDIPLGTPVLLRRGQFRAGVLQAHANAAGMAMVDVGTHTLMPYPADQLVAYTGVVSVWRKHSVLSCDRSDCAPQMGPFDRYVQCGRCGDRPKAVWTYTGTMASTADQVPPLRWPDAVIFPADYDPNCPTEAQ